MYLLDESLKIKSPHTRFHINERINQIHIRDLNWQVTLMCKNTSHNILSYHKSSTEAYF